MQNESKVEQTLTSSNVHWFENAVVHPAKIIQIMVLKNCWFPNGFGPPCLVISSRSNFFFKQSPSRWAETRLRMLSKEHFDSSREKCSEISTIVHVYIMLSCNHTDCYTQRFITLHKLLGIALNNLCTLWSQQIQENADDEDTARLPFTGFQKHWDVNLPHLQ